MKFQKVLCKFIVVLFFLMISTISWADIIEDNFNDNTLDTELWTSEGEISHRWAYERNGHLEIAIDGTEDDAAGVMCNTFIPINQDLKVHVDFNSSECSESSAIGLMIANATTDIEHGDEYIVIGNGHDANYTTARSWIAGKAIDDIFIETEIQPTSSVSGTFYIEKRGNTFYVSFTGYGTENVLTSFTISDWTSCNQLIVRLFAWSGYQVLSGQGSYFDNFKLDYYPSSLQKGMPWVTSLLLDD